MFSYKTCAIEKTIPVNKLNQKVLPISILFISNFTHISYSSVNFINTQPSSILVETIVEKADDYSTNQDRIYDLSVVNFLLFQCAPTQ